MPLTTFDTHAAVTALGCSASRPRSSSRWPPSCSVPFDVDCSAYCLRPQRPSRTPKLEGHDHTAPPMNLARLAGLSTRHGVSDARRPRRRWVCAAGQDSTREDRQAQHGTGMRAQAGAAARLATGQIPSPRSRLYAALRDEPASHGPTPTARPPNGAPRDTRTPHEPETVSGIDQPPQSRRYRGPATDRAPPTGRICTAAPPLRHGRVRRSRRTRQ